MAGFLAWVGEMPIIINHVLGVIGGVAGFVYGLNQPEHHPQYLFAVIGWTIGFIVIPFAALISTLLIKWAVYALLAAAVYYAFWN